MICFGGMEQDKQSSSYTTYFRQYDPRIARWKSTDPVTQPWQSPYTAFDNNPILYVDPMGDVSWCGIGTVFSGLASFAGNMALRALPTLGLNIALNNFLPNATHTGNNSGRFLGADGNVGGGGESLKAGDSFVGNDGKTYTFSFDEFEVVDSKPVYTHPLPKLGPGLGSVDFFDIPFIYLEAFVGEALYSIGASESTVKYATYSIVLMSFIKGKPIATTKAAAKGVKKTLPALDATGKVHGTLPKVKDFGQYSKDELQILLGELKQSVQKRIEVTSKMGRDRAHGQRQGAEQDLIKSLEKYLGN